MKTKEEEVTANSVQNMHSTMSTVSINLCQFKVSGNEIEYNKAIKEQLLPKSKPRTTYKSSSSDLAQRQSAQERDHVGHTAPFTYRPS
jgi:hypothetical protein